MSEQFSSIEVRFVNGIAARYQADRADDTPTESFEDWYNKKSNTVPQFKYWDMVLKHVVVLQLIKSLRSVDFSLYKDFLSRLIGWFFVFDQVHYVRCLAVHIRDLANLPQTHPDVNTNFEARNFVAMKTKRAFSAIALDQNHEQVNACLKGDGGMIGLTERSDSLLKWLLITPELAANIARFEEAGFLTHVDVFGHHSDKKSFINLYPCDITSLKATFESLGNPFEDTYLSKKHFDRRFEGHIRLNEHLFEAFCDILDDSRN
ncbi:hypothetical protein FQA39_LY00083 [Lamprigera yunnana]|nr:hypothetical protein FQA39_LY00083 [Lamprigera yunnana]